MTLAEQIALKAAELSSDRQREVLDFVEFLRARPSERGRAATRRRGGAFVGMPYEMSEDFDAPLPDEFWTGETP